MVKPTSLFWKGGKHLFKYVRFTTKYGLWYIWTEGVKLQGFIDVDWVGTPSDRKSTSGAIFSIGSTTISSYSRKQILVALNSAEEEYMEASYETCEAI